MVEKTEDILDMCIRFDRAHESDRRTERHDGIAAIMHSIARQKPILPTATPYMHGRHMIRNDLSNHSNGAIQWPKQEAKVIWQKAPHGGPIPRLGVTPGGRKLYHWIAGVGFPISVP